MTSTLSVRMKREARERADALAAERGICTSELVRQLLEELTPGAQPVTWAEINREVRALAAKVKPGQHTPNPVLEERRKEREKYAKYLR